MDREKLIQEIVAALLILEKSGDKDIESVKRFLRWLPDNALQDIRDKVRHEAQDTMLYDTANRCPYSG